MPTTHAARTTDRSVRAMIDDYLATRGPTVVAATAPELKPLRRRLNWDSLTPHATAASVYRATTATKSRSSSASAEGWPDLTRTVVSIGECPSAPGSSRAQRFSILAVGATLASLREAGLRLGDLQRYLSAGVVILSETPGETDGAVVGEVQSTTEEL